MSTTPFILADDTVVSTIDTNSDWFKEEFADPIALPGKRRAADTEKAENKVSRAQAGGVIRRLQKRADLSAMPLSAAMDFIRGRNDEFGANLRGNQFDFNVVNYCAHLDQLENVNEPLTVGQENMIDIHVKALLGTEAHFNDETQAAIEKLTPEQRDRFVDAFEECETRGQLSSVMQKYQRRVPNPATTQSRRSRSQEAVAGVDLDSPEEAF